jgi:ferredoxin
MLSRARFGAFPRTTTLSAAATWARRCTTSASTASATATTPAGSASAAAATKVKVTFVDAKKKVSTIPATGAPGVTLLSVALAHQVDIEAACDGTCACSTCHVYVDDAHFDKLPRATEDEEDMLDLAIDRRRTSRLCCQLNLTAELEGMTLTLPKEVTSQLS